MRVMCGHGTGGVMRVAVDQVVRLRAFKAEHPEVIVGALGLGGPWQARIPGENGENVITRYELRDLLDILIEMLSEPGSETP